MVFGTQPVCARLGAPDLWWGDSRLPAVDTVKSCGSAFSRAGAESLCRRLELLSDGQRYISGYQFYASAATKLLVPRFRIVPCMSYGMELWRPSKCCANMTAVLVRAARLISDICKDASHTAFFMGRSVNQDVMLPDLDVLSADDHCCMAHARQYGRHMAAATAAAQYTRNGPCLPEFDVELSAAYAPDYMGAAAWNGLHTRDGWYSFALTCHDTALSHCVHPEAALMHTDPFVVGGAERATC